MLLGQGRKEGRKVPQAEGHCVKGMETGTPRLMSSLLGLVYKLGEQQGPVERELCRFRYSATVLQFT